VNPEQRIQAFLPDEILNEAVRWRLNQNDCQNRGYILDGYPKSYETAFGVFFTRNKAPEKKVVLNDEGEPIPQEDEMDEEQLKQFLKPKF
jgi:adenylate kinase